MASAFLRIAHDLCQAAVKSAAAHLRHRRMNSGRKERVSETDPSVLGHEHTRILSLG